MNIEIKKSIKPVKYKFALNKMERRLEEIISGKKMYIIFFKLVNDIA